MVWELLFSTLHWQADRLMCAPNLCVEFNALCVELNALIQRTIQRIGHCKENLSTLRYDLFDILLPTEIDHTYVHPPQILLK